MWLTPSQGPGESHSRRLASAHPPLVSTVADRLVRCLSGIAQLSAHARAALQQAADAGRRRTRSSMDVTVLHPARSLSAARLTGRTSACRPACRRAGRDIRWRPRAGSIAAYAGASWGMPAKSTQSARQTSPTGPHPLRPNRPRLYTSAPRIAATFRSTTFKATLETKDTRARRGLARGGGRVVRPACASIALFDYSGHAVQRRPFAL